MASRIFNSGAKGWRVAVAGDQRRTGAREHACLVTNRTERSSRCEPNAQAASTNAVEGTSSSALGAVAGIVPGSALSRPMRGPASRAGRLASGRTESVRSVPPRSAPASRRAAESTRSNDRGAQPPLQSPATSNRGSRSCAFDRWASSSFAFSQVQSNDRTKRGAPGRHALASKAPTALAASVGLLATGARGPTERDRLPDQETRLYLPRHTAVKGGTRPRPSLREEGQVDRARHLLIARRTRVQAIS